MATEREYRFAVTPDDEVVASTSENAPLWRLRLPRRAQSDALLSDPQERVRCAVRRLRRFPRPRYVLLAGEELLGTLDSLNVWRTRYRLVSPQGRSCEFHMPLFSTYFTATSENTPLAQVRMLRENVWAVLFQPDEDRPELIAMLARILAARWLSE